MRVLRARIERVAPTEATILILGERGTGKELVARAIQAASRRRDRAFVVVNCAAIPTELLASELFGHERGAFTGAARRHRGLLAAAHGGTLFLDEVGDLPLTAQAMLLRFLQEGEIRAVGSAATSRLDVRLLAATNKNVPVAIERGEFRADLYDRLREIPVELPSLRVRVQDIAALVHELVRRQAMRHHVRCRGVTAEALAILERHDWPGNVRELQYTLSRAVIFADGGYIRPEHLEVGDREDGVPTEHGPSRSRQARRRDIVRMAVRAGQVRPRDLCLRFGTSRKTAHGDLAALVRAGLLTRLGVGRGSHYVPRPR